MRDCDNCARCGRDGCKSWDCDFIPRKEAIKAWKEKHETADRKTEPTISKMEQVDKDINVRSKDEPQTEKPKIRKRIDKPFRAVWLDDDHNEIGTPQTERSE